MCITEVWCSGVRTRLETCDLCTYYIYLLITSRTGRSWEQQLRQTQFGSSSWRSGCSWKAAVEVDAVGKKQLTRMQSGSGSWSGCSRGVQVKADVSGEQQLKKMQSESSRCSRRNLRSAAEEDAIREQQLKWVKLLVWYNCYWQCHHKEKSCDLPSNVLKWMCCQHQGMYL